MVQNDLKMNITQDGPIGPFRHERVNFTFYSILFNKLEITLVEKWMAAKAIFFELFL